MAARFVNPFTELLYDISEEFTTKEFKKIKTLLKMDDHLTKRELEDTDSALDLLYLMCERDLISCGNLGLLKSYLKTMKMIQVLEKVNQFEEANTLEAATGPGLQEIGEGEVGTLHEVNSGVLQSAFSFPILALPMPESSRDVVVAAQQPLAICSDDTIVKQRLPVAAGVTSPGVRSSPCLTLDCENSEPLEADGYVMCRKKTAPDGGGSGPADGSGRDVIGKNSTAGADDLKPESEEYERMREPNSTAKQSSFEIIYKRENDRSPAMSERNLMATQLAALTLEVAGSDLEAITLRGYQLELAQPSSLGKLNNIICAPTGSGKTVTAGYIFRERKKNVEEGQRFRGLFIVCQRTLVLQQKRALERFLAPDVSIGAVEENQTLKEVLLLPLHLIVLTAQKFVNALDSGSVRIEDLDMLILDECHHTDLNHPYNKIMRFYHQIRLESDGARNLPMIVGLTASLGVGSGKQETSALQHYINICANLDCTCITHVRDEKNKLELLRFNPKPRADQIKSVPARSADSPFYKVLTQFMRNIESETRLTYSRPQERGTQVYENWIVERRSEAVQRADLPHIITACDVLMRLNLAWMLHDQLRIKDAEELLDSYFTPDWLPIQPSPIQQQIMKWYQTTSVELKQLAEDESVESCPQLQQLCQLLAQLHGYHSDPRGILLARTRLVVDRLTKFLSEQTQFKDVIFPAKFVGQGGTEGTMTQVEQENTLRRFRLGNDDPARINLLVATDVAQEGLDMPKCSYVIRYNFVSNEIGSVQSRGRARAPNSELYLIVTCGSVNEMRELENLQKEHQMQEALNQIDVLEQTQLQQAITDLQKKNWLAYQNQLERNRMRASAISSDQVTIHCSKCKSLLCGATEMRQRGSNYICIATDFEERIWFKSASTGKEFISEIHLGYIFCKAPNCQGNQLGLKIQYKQGQRLHGYVLRREGCVFKTAAQDSLFMAIKQWSKVPFTVERELL